MNNRADSFSVLTEFNPALAYAFDPESPENNDTASGQALHLVGQHLDVIRAYQYAQESILPEIQKMGLQNITEEQILLWINKIHERMAATLAKDLDTVSGVYTKQQVARWVDVDIRDGVAKYFHGLISEKDFKEVCSQFNIPLADAKAFMKLLKEVERQDIKISEDQLEFINKDSASIVIALFKLSTLYHNNSLTKEQKDLIGKFQKICLPPTQLKSAMQDYAKDLVAKLKLCDSKNIDSVINVLFDAFYGLTEIHPFFNGNGRTATCWMNILLRTFGYPSILLRNPQERNNPNSTYSKAVKNINIDSALMKIHLKQRIEDAQKGLVFQDNELRALIQLRIEMVSLLLEIQKKNNYSSEALENLYNRVLMESAQQCMQTGRFKFDLKHANETYTNEFSIVLNKRVAEKFEHMLGRAKQTGLKDMSVYKPKYDPAKKADIVNCLKLLTGKQDEKLWKTYVKNDVLIVHLNLDTKDEANALQKKAQDEIKDEQIVKITRGRNKEKEKEVVSFEIINADKLLNINPASTLENVR